MKRFLAISAVAFLLTADETAHAAVELVANGGFENPSGAPGFFPWVEFGLSAGNDLEQGVGNTNPHSGEAAAYFGPPETLSGIYQDLDTENGKQYSLSFWLANEGTTPNTFEVRWEGVLLPLAQQFASINDLPSTDVNGGPPEFVQFNYLVTANSSTDSRLQFGFFQFPGYFDLDDVSVVEANAAVPEPASVTIWCLGVVGGYLGYRRRKKRHR